MSADGPCPTGLDLAALNYLSYGLYIVTAREGERRNGCIVNTAVQVALDPCFVTVSLSKKNLTTEMIARTGRFAFQVLEKDAPLVFIGVFGFRTGREMDKFANVGFRDGANGCPVVMKHTLVSVEATVKQTVDCGSHVLFVATATASAIIKPGEPLTYAYYHETKGGKTAKNAPTYQGAQKASAKAESGEESGPAGEERTQTEERSRKMKKYVCVVCGYVYDPEEGDAENGVKPGTSFEELPDEWVCPVCGATKEEFEPQED